jgi:hypothetical protein
MSMHAWSTPSKSTRTTLHRDGSDPVIFLFPSPKRRSTSKIAWVSNERPLEPAEMPREMGKEKSVEKPEHMVSEQAAMEHAAAMREMEIEEEDTAAGAPQAESSRRYERSRCEWIRRS